MSFMEDQCTPVLDNISFSHFGLYNNAVITIFRANTDELPIVTIDIFNISLFGFGCPVTLTIRTKRSTITEIIPTNANSSFTCEDVLEITGQCSGAVPTTTAIFMEIFSLTAVFAAPATAVQEEGTLA